MSTAEDWKHCRHEWDELAMMDGQNPTCIRCHARRVRLAVKVNGKRYEVLPPIGDDAIHFRRERVEE